jgi:hypothetical protein
VRASNLLDPALPTPDRPLRHTRAKSGTQHEEAQMARTTSEAGGQDEADESTHGGLDAPSQAEGDDIDAETGAGATDDESAASASGSAD